MASPSGHSIAALDTRMAAAEALAAAAGVNADLPYKLKVKLADGAAADTNIAVAGIVAADRIISVIHNTAGVLADLTSEAAITSSGNVQLADTDTTGDQLLILWYDVSATAP